MNLPVCLGLVLFELGAGAMLFTALLPTGEIRSSFFAFQSFLGAAAVALAVLLRGFSSGELAWTILVVMTALVAAQTFRHEKLRLGRMLLAGAGLIAVPLMLARLPDPFQPLTIEFTWTRFWYLLLFPLAGLLLVGATHTAMVLGHWYLLMRKLSFVYLIRFCWLALGAVLVRIAVLGLGWAALRGWAGDYGAALLDRALDANTLFFGARVVMGLVAPLLFGIMSLRCASLRANQAATGLLYLSEAMVFFGELFAVYLLL